MNLYETQFTMLNPMDAEQQQKVISLASGAPYLPSFMRINNLDNQFLLAYPVVSYVKPERVSKKTGAVKPASTRYAVCDNHCLGQGSFGLVYPVLGIWKLKEGNWVLKAGTPHDRKVLKTNLDLTRNKFISTKGVASSYKSEYEIGQNVPYMGYQIKPFFHAVEQHHDKAAFLLMNRQEGVSLRSLIEKNSLTSNQRLILCINLIKALEQLHTRQANGNYLVHCDIKPENIMVDEELNVRYIDFGLSGLNVQLITGANRGTPIYTDPFLFSSNTLIKQDDNHDKGSLARVIAEIWGDDSRQIALSEDEVHEANQYNFFTHLFEDLTDLTEIEKQIIHKCISQLTEYELQDRAPMASVLDDFTQLLDYRKQNEAQQLADLAATPLTQLSKEQLLVLLNSPYAAGLIERFIKEPNEYLRLKSLGATLFTLERPLLARLQQNKFNFPSFILSSTRIRNAKLSAEQTQYALELGVQLPSNTLNQWVNQPGVSLDPEWAKLFRVLYKATPNAEASLTFTPQNSFAKVFFQFFVKHPETAKDDALNLQLSQQHMQVCAELAQLDRTIVELLDKIGADKPLAVAIGRAAAMPDTLISVVPRRVRDLVRQMEKFISIASEISELHTGSSKELAQVKNRLVINLMNRFMLNGMDWASALDIDSLLVEYEHVLEVDRLIKKLERLYPPTVYVMLHQGLDVLYASAPSSLNELKAKASQLCGAAQVLNKIEILKLRLCNLDAELLVTHPFIIEYTQFLANEIKFEPTQDTVEAVTNAHSLFEQLTTLFEQLTALKNSSLPCHRKGLMQKLHASTYTALNELTSEKLIQLFAQTNEFFELEQQFAVGLSAQGNASEFFYALMATNLSSDATSAYTEYTMLFKRIKDYSLIDNSLTQRINQYIKLTAPHNGLATLHAEFNETVWNYLTVGFEDRHKHRSQCHQALDVLIGRATDVRVRQIQAEEAFRQASHPDSLFEPSKKRRRPTDTPVLSPLLNGQNLQKPFG